MRLCLRRHVGAAAAVIASLAVASPALGHTIVVHPGQSIQAAIDKAARGDTISVLPGTYTGGLLITTDRIKLRAQHGDEWNGGVFLVPPTKITPNACSFGGPTDLNGICVLGQLDNNGNLVKATSGVRVNGFTVTGFPGVGVFDVGGNGTRISHNRLIDNGSYGVFTNTSTNAVITQNYAKGSGEAGIYVGDSPNSNAYVAWNRSVGNRQGFLFRDASYGTARHNFATHNCAGMVVIDTPAPTGADHWTLQGNTVWSNNKACAGDPAHGQPALSGLGIGLSGATNTTVSHNIVLNNVPSGQSAFSGGILLVSAAKSGGAEESNVTIRRNVVLDNQQVDLFWDGAGTGIAFRHNFCETSTPTSLCSR